MIDSLAARGDAAACQAIANSLASPDAAVRRAAINAAGRMGETWAVSLLCLSSPAPRTLEERRAIETALIACAEARKSLTTPSSLP